MISNNISIYSLYHGCYYLCVSLGYNPSHRQKNETQRVKMQVMINITEFCAATQKGKYVYKIQPNPHPTSTPTPLIPP